MGWFDAVDYYCERLGPGFGGEPFNMLTGLAFLAVGLFAFRRAPAVEDRLAAAALGLVGLASAVQHGFALGVTVKADLAATPWIDVVDGVPEKFPVGRFVEIRARLLISEDDVDESPVLSDVCVLQDI